MALPSAPGDRCKFLLVLLLEFAFAGSFLPSLSSCVCSQQSRRNYSAPKYGKYSRVFSLIHVLECLLFHFIISLLLHWWDQRSYWEQDFLSLKCRIICASVLQAADFLGQGDCESKGKSLNITRNTLPCLNGKKNLGALSESNSVSAKGSKCL